MVMSMMMTKLMMVAVVMRRLMKVKTMKQSKNVLRKCDHLVMVVSWRAMSVLSPFFSSAEFF